MAFLLAAPLISLMAFSVTVMTVTAPVAVMVTFAVMVVAVVSPMPVVARVVLAAVTSPSQIRTRRVGPRIMILVGLMVSKPESRRSVVAIGY